MTSRPKSTLLQTDIDQDNVQQFARDIIAHNYSMAQLEIDDRWQSRYGDLVWDFDKFPNRFMLFVNLSRVSECKQVDKWCRFAADGRASSYYMDISIY